MCRYERGWELRETSPWCAAFSKKDLKVMEYYEDLDLYYEAGYANKMTPKLGCTTLQDIVKRFS